MISTRAVLCGILILALPNVASARLRSDRDRLRAEAEHACYGDAQRLCSDAIPDEARIKACMEAKRAQLSPACGKFFSHGMRR